ncbi:MAG: radical SAM protein [Candidatus Cloacimonetes bacterium]|nr:radical SAM protein [Candidatus Cloacimonadota bacterium]
MEDRRLDIKTGFICNNNCRFCVQADNKLKGNRSFEDIKKDLIDSKERCQGVVLTGGEVTIHAHFFDIVKLAKSLGYKLIQIQTNGRMLSSLDFCKKTIQAGATEFSPALHGYCAEQHDYLTQAKGSFNQTVKGIRNLQSLGAKFLTNTVVVKSNYTTLDKIAKLLISLKASQYQFAFVHPMGNAWKNFDNIVPRISMAAPLIHKALQIGIHARVAVMAEAMPYCHMIGYEDCISEKRIPETEIRGAKHQNTKNYTKERLTQGKSKFDQCKECKFDSVCEGPWREYPQKLGHSEFNPPEYKKESFGYSLINEIETARRVLNTGGIPLNYKLHILLVYCQLKPAASIDNITDKSVLPMIYKKLDQLGLTYKLIEGKKTSKLVVAREDNLRKIEQIHDDVFINKKEAEVDIGRLFGYPECCITKRPTSWIDKVEKVNSKLINMYAKFPLTFHRPCSPDCVNSIELAKKIASVYYYFDKQIFHEIMTGLSIPVLIFDANTYVKFTSCRKDENTLHYDEVIVNVQSDIDDVSVPANKQHMELINKIKLGNKLTIENNTILCHNKNKLLFQIDLDNCFFINF